MQKLLWSFPNTYTLGMTWISIPSMVFYYWYTKQQKDLSKLLVWVLFLWLDVSRAFLQRNHLSLPLDSVCLKVQCCFLIHMIRGSRSYFLTKIGERISLHCPSICVTLNQQGIYIFFSYVENLIWYFNSPLPSALPVLGLFLLCSFKRTVRKCR